jgi:4-amino-4-deoxy-L-arabinose transferase-like glycosyltransferase
MSSKRQRVLLIVILAISSLLRFGNLAWGEGYYFHPDENNVAQALLNLDQKWDPEFYAYGQLPLFLALFSARIYQLFSFVHQQPNLSFSQAILFLRFWSALGGVASIWLGYLLGKKLISYQAGLIAATIISFSPGLIQASHFGTTESLLTFFYLAIGYFSVCFYQKNRTKDIILASIFSGLALATKISAAFFILMPLLALLISHKKLTYWLGTAIIILAAAIIFSPFSIIDFPQTLNTLKYEVAIAQGKVETFYTRQFLETTPFIFQITKIFPFSIGWPTVLISLLGLIIIMFQNPPSLKILSSWLIILIPTLIFFLYQGQLFVKWTRFMTPILPIFSLLSAQALNKFPRLMQYTVLIVSLLPGVAFFDITYAQIDTRLQFSYWAKENIPSESIILSETGNTLSLPLGEYGFEIINFNFYDLEEKSSQNQLCQLLEKANYIVIPSRRVFANHPQNKFPNTVNYYQKLFSKRLGFSQLKVFSPNGHLPTTPFYKNEEAKAEETWTVFDHPTIRVYQKTKPYSAKEYQQLIFE